MAHETTLLERLADAPVVGDGAMGTYLHELGHDIHQGPETLSLTDPDAVRRVHAAYIEAGAELIETNTFGADALSLAAHGQKAMACDLNAAAAGLALAAAGTRAWVAGSIGPVAVAPQEENWDEAAVRAAYREQAEVLCNSGVHALLLETFDDLDGLLLALDECRGVSGGRILIIAQTVFADGFAAGGVGAAEVAIRLAEAGAAVVGANCGRGLEAMRQAVEGLLAGSEGRAFVSAYPNAGYPERIGGRTVYLATAAYIAQQAVEWARCGVRLIGGCCGTTPETIRAIRQGVAGLRRVPQVRVAAAPAGQAVAPAAPEAPAAGRAGGFLESLSGRLPIIAELDPPPHLEWQPRVAGAKSLLAAGVQAVSLADNPLASIRMDNFFLGGLIRRETGGQVVCHLTGRDRNSIGLQSTLLGAHAAGIEAVLAITGDPAQRGVHQRVASVYELNSTGFVRLLAGLNRGRSATGRDLHGATNFSIGVAFNSAAANLKAEASRLQRKHAEGAAFVMTQPVFDAQQARRVLEKTRLNGLRVFLGFLPPVSLKLALHLHYEVPGIRLPQALLDRLAAFDQPADQERAALEHTTHLLETLAPDLDGIYLITPGARWRCLLPLIARAKELRQAQRAK